MVEFLGRIDHQVKIRGFRIELGEIEAVLEQHPGVRQAVAVARENETGEKFLAAYYIPAQDRETPPVELREYLRQQLPDYMIPPAFVALSAFPLTPNGKVDRKALPEPKAEDYQSNREYTAPRDATERKLVALWEEVLHMKPVGIKDSFFDLGGQSMVAGRLFARISRTFGKELPLSTLFQSPTIEQLAQHLRPKAESLEYPTVVAIKASGSRPPFFCVHGGAGSTLFLHRLASRLHPDQPFYGIEPEGMDGRPFQRPRIEEMAAHYLAEIRKVQPEGPYYIGGYCFGGIVSFEMARQLQARGETPAVTVLLYAELSFNHYARPPKPPKAPVPVRSGWERLAQLLSAPGRSLAWRWKNLRLGWYSAWLHAWRALATHIAWKVYGLLFRTGRCVPASMRTMYIVRVLERAEQLYFPKPYSGALELFHGSGKSEFGPNLGWDGLAQLQHHVIVGGRRGDARDRRILMDTPLMAEKLTACLESVAHPTAKPR